ncbi:hypothetical protein CGC47_04715 [Capnocytophaga canimorsus]|nr:hypothetical protein CGC47_04715 [Capnocytophaga canimorsus]
MGKIIFYIFELGRKNCSVKFHKNNTTALQFAKITFLYNQKTYKKRNFVKSALILIKSTCLPMNK